MPDLTDATSLTHSDQETLLYKVAGKKFTSKGRLFEPTVTFYNQLTSDDGLLHAAKDFYKWLGVKPYQLHVSFATSDESFSLDDKGTLLISEHLRDFPYQTASALAVGICQHFLEHRHHEPSDANLVEQATITYGFGLIVLNGLTGHASWLEKLHQLRNGHWLAHSFSPLRTRSNASYASDFESYIDGFKIADSDYLQLLSSASRKLLKHGNSVAVSDPELPKVLQDHKHASKKHWIKLGLVAAIFALLICITLFVIAQKPTKPSKEVVDQYNAIMKLKQRYDACQSQAEKQQNSLDVSNDIFMQQQVDSTLNTCDSLRNEYNSKVQSYNQIVGN